MYTLKYDSLHISMNLSYMIYFQNSRDKTQIRLLSHQLAPENAKFV